LLDPGLGPSLVGRDLTLGYESGLGFGSLACGSSSPKWESLYPISPDAFLFLSGRRDGTFWVIAVTSGLGLLVSRCLRLALRIFNNYFDYYLFCFFRQLRNGAQFGHHTFVPIRHFSLENCQNVVTTIHLALFIVTLSHLRFLHHWCSSIHCGTRRREIFWLTSGDSRIMNFVTVRKSKE